MAMLTGFDAFHTCASRTLANDILEQIVKPFKTFIEGQKEARKQVRFILLLQIVVDQC